MIKFKRNNKTGILEAWKDGKKISNVITQGDDTKKKNKNKSKK